MTLPRLSLFGITPFLLAFLGAGCLGTNEDESPSTLAPGIYESKGILIEGSDTLRFSSRVEIRDSFYYQQGYIDHPAYFYHSELAYEEKGKFALRGGLLENSQILAREAHVSGTSIGAWKEPEDGPETSQKIRRITARSFETYDEDMEAWVRWKRLDERVTVSAFNGTYSNPRLGFSLAFPESWAFTQDFPSDRVYTLTARRAYDPAYPEDNQQFDILEIPTDSTGGLENLMKQEVARLRNDFQTVFDSSVTMENGVMVGTVAGYWSLGDRGGSVRIFSRGASTVLIRAEGSLRNQKKGGDLSSIDSSLTFF